MVSVTFFQVWQIWVIILWDPNNLGNVHLKQYERQSYQDILIKKNVFGNLYFSLISVVKLFLEKIVNWVGKIPRKSWTALTKIIVGLDTLVLLHKYHFNHQKKSLLFLDFIIDQYSLPAMFGHLYLALLQQQNDLFKVCSHRYQY